MRLSPLAALRRDREQFIYNWMLEDDLNLDKETGRKPNGREEKRTNQGNCYAYQVVTRIHANQGHCYANQVVTRIHANQGHCYANQVVMRIHAN